METELLLDYFENFSTRGERYHFTLGEIKSMRGKIETNIRKLGKTKFPFQVEGTFGGVPDMGMGFQTGGWGSSQGWGSRHWDGVPVRDVVPDKDGVPDMGMGFLTWGWGFRHGDGVPDMGMGFLKWGGVPDMGMGFQTRDGVPDMGWGSRHGDGVPDMGMGVPDKDGVPDMGMGVPDMGIRVTKVGIIHSLIFHLSVSYHTRWKISTTQVYQLTCKCFTTLWMSISMSTIGGNCWLHLTCLAIGCTIYKRGLCDTSNPWVFGWWSCGQD